MAAIVSSAVPPAHLSGVLTDQALDAITHVADRVDQGSPLTDSDAALVMACFGPAARELQQWRRKSALIQDVLSENVLMFPGAR